MKKLFLFSCLLITFVASATTYDGEILGLAPGQNLSLECVTRHFPSTSFVVETSGDRVTLKMIHHNTTAYMPIHDGIITPSDFNYLQQKADRLVKMGDFVEVSWPKKNCEIFGENLAGCFRGERRTVGSAELGSYAFFTRVITHRVFDLDITYLQVTFSPIIDSFSMDVTMDFALSDCKMNF